MAFLAVAGWGGLWLLNMGLHPIFAVFLAIAMGFWAMLLMALFLRVALHLQSDGTMDLRNALGRAGYGVSDRTRPTGPAPVRSRSSFRTSSRSWTL